MVQMGESAVGAYLRLCIGCEIVTYNQRLSKIPNEMGETDVLGIDIDRTTIYICEVVTHLGGILYGSGNESTLKKLTEKFERAAEYGSRAFPNHRLVLMLWAPNVPVGYLTNGLQALQERLAKRHYLLELRINRAYAESIDELRELAHQVTKDYGEPFFRALQILEHLRR